MPGRRSIDVAAAGFVLLGKARYRRYLQRDRERLARSGPSVIDTPFGRVEYAQAGDGPPVMVVHGVFGGFDLGVGVGRANVPAGYRIVSPSRFGFFGSPVPPEPSPAAQADAFAELLDHLKIVELPLVAFSAGSSSALQLALRHPERVSRLVLISPNSPPPEPLPLLAPIIFSQPEFSAIRLLARSRLEGMSGTPAGFVPDERERAALREIVDILFPVGPRARAARSTTATSATSTSRPPHSSRSRCRRSSSPPRTTRWRRTRTRGRWPSGSRARGSSASVAAGTR